MSPAYETFVLYYIAWHDKEFSLAEMKISLLSELGLDGFAEALGEFKAKRKEREAAGDYRTLFETMKE